MIQPYETVRDATALGTAVPENPIPLRKKEHFQVRQRRSCKHLTLMAGSNRFACRKSYQICLLVGFFFEAIATQANAEVGAETRFQ